MRYRLRTLLIVLAVGPALIAWGWSEYLAWHGARMREEQIRSIKTASGGIGYGPLPHYAPGASTVDKPSQEE
jgi:hypothetical protein